MPITSRKAAHLRPRYAWPSGGSAVAAVAVAAGAAGAVAVFVAAQSAGAAAAPVDLGTAGSFGVLAGQTVTNTGPSTVIGDLGVSPGTAVTGFPPGIVFNGTIHSADGVANGAQSDLTTAYNDAAGRSPTANVPAFIGAGQTLAPGVYKASSSLDVGGSLTLDAGGDPNAVFIFQAPSTLITDSASSVTLTNGAQACNVFWQVGSSATLGTNSAFTGTVLALTSISVQTGDTIEGRALARNGAVTLDDDTIVVPTCAITPPAHARRRLARRRLARRRLARRRPARRRLVRRRLARRRLAAPPTSPPPTSPPPTSPPPTSPPPTSPPPTSPPPTSPPPTSPPPTSPPPTTAPPTSPPPTRTPTPAPPRPTGPAPGPAPSPVPSISNLPVTG